MTKSRKFSPVFQAQVTFGEVIVGTTAQGFPYAKSRSKVTYPKGGTQNRQVMVFGDRYEKLKDLLVSGNTVSLAIQHDENTVLLVGHPRDRKKAA